ncbi:MAG: hypothetical protein IJ358_01370 [Clostridia bacterium]|nr:hypothetical protein [Clostridia bacterium]
MKTKTSNKLNMLLIAITLLLVFVAGAKVFGSTNSWLKTEDQVGFTVTVTGIQLSVKQDNRTIPNNGMIYLNTDIVEADTAYDLNVSITNNELGSSYYIRCQAFAVVNGTTYNINNCITNDLYKNSTDNWMYITSGSTSSTPVQIPSGESVVFIDTVTFPSSVLGSLEGKYVKLYLYIEGSSSADFSV